jgi:hypothetical protein
VGARDATCRDLRGARAGGRLAGTLLDRFDVARGVFATGIEPNLRCASSEFLAKHSSDLVAAGDSVVAEAIVPSDGVEMAEALAGDLLLVSARRQVS